MRRTLLASLALAAALAGAIVFVSCARTDDQPDDRAGSATRLTEPEDAVSEDLMLALAQAKNLHHKAKVFMSDGNLAEATAAVRQILAVQFPAGAAEAEDVRLDARALLAKLLIGQGKLDEASHVVDEGLASATRDSFFVANLYTVQGEIHEARAAAVAAGDASAPAARDERHAAIEAYDRSIQINERLQKKLMEDR